VSKEKSRKRVRKGKSLVRENSLKRERMIVKDKQKNKWERAQEEGEES